MYAIIETGGKQYTVKCGDVLKVEKLQADAGDLIVLENVLAVLDGKDSKMDASGLGKAKVSAHVLEQGKGDKVIIFKKKRRHTYKRTRGHRQQLTTLRIDQIDLEGKVAAKKGAIEPQPKKKSAQPVSAAPKKAAAKKAEPKAKAAPKKETAAKKSTAAKKPAAKAKKDE